MPRLRFPLVCLAGIATLLVAACSGAATPTPTTSRTPTPAPSPTPLPPDTMSVGVLDLGVGTFDLAAFPVATLKNEARYHGAAGVIVHFVTHRAGRTLGSLDSLQVNLGPGESLSVAAECVDACNDATSVVATVTVGSWPTDIGPIFATVPGAYSCSPCRAGHGYGNVMATLTPSATLSAGAAVTAFAVCKSSSGLILGGGTEEYIWQAGASFSANVPVVLNAAPSSCWLGASAGW
jgi:hypothetical protein